jgi:hypothetical protein
MSRQHVKDTLINAERRANQYMAGEVRNTEAVSYAQRIALTDPLLAAALLIKVADKQGLILPPPN